MNINTRTLSGIALLALLLVACVIGYRYSQASENGKKLELQTFNTEGGWGYEILLDKKVMISQPIVPVIDTIMPFPSEKSARTLGQIVLKKIINKEDFAVSKQEVEYSLSY